MNKLGMSGSNRATSGTGRWNPESRSAFTLIELLVVVSIIALLLSILLPSLKSARDQGKLVKCLAHMRGSGQAAAVFAADRQGRFQLVTDEIGIADADPLRQVAAYGNEGELLSWPVALALGSEIGYSNNWDWGVRAVSYDAALQQQKFMSTDLEFVTCPSDQIRISTAYYPRNKSGTNNGIKGSGDPDNPQSSTTDMSYWGFLSYAVNEDVAGVEVSESNDHPACWRSVLDSGGEWIGCKGEFGYPPTTPCGRDYGRRLRGRLDEVYRPGDVGLIFEAGADPDTDPDDLFANLVTSALADGPYLSDFQEFHQTRLPSRRHPKGRVNVLYADLHGGTSTPVNINATTGIPETYAPQVRVSPYEPHDVD